MPYNKPLGPWPILITSILTVFFGIAVFIDPAWYSTIDQIYFDLTAYRYPFAILCVLVGGIGTIVSFRALNRETVWNEMMICPDCEQTIIAYKAQDGRCPQCDSELEPLYGFYERHPEMKDK